MTFFRTEKKWIFRSRETAVPEEQVKKVARDLGIPENIAMLLAFRGFSDLENISNFLTPSLRSLPRPHLMKGMADAVTILLEAMKHRKPVTVFGDFDADGVTATAILSLFFTELFMPMQTYIPDRMTEGYGLNLTAVQDIHDRCMRQWGEAGVLLTADCGISDAEAVKAAKDLGFTVIITDHHRPPESLPAADAILNPHQPGCPFPCKDLAGVGVAFYLMLGLRSELMTKGHWPEDKIPNLKSYMDLVAIGTVADQVPVTGCNRIMIKAGLEILNRTQRVGLRKLLDYAKTDDSEVTVEDIAFRMAPRINAVGRIGSAHKAVKLMTTYSPEEARVFAAELEKANTARRSIEADIFAEAADMVTPEILSTWNSLVLYKNDWHQGVLGIVASRLSEQFFRPTILLTDCPRDYNEQSGQTVKGSGRSIEGIDLHAAVTSCQAMLHRYGGHAGAVGLTFPMKNIEPFRQQFDAVIGAQTNNIAISPSLYIDMQTTLNDITNQGFLAAYTSLAPFGSGNPEPVFCMKSRKLENLRLVGANHLRFTLIENDQTINGIGFGFGRMAEASQMNLMDLAFSLRLNSYMGRGKWELNLVDLRPAGT